MKKTVSIILMSWASMFTFAQNAQEVKEILKNIESKEQIDLLPEKYSVFHVNMVELKQNSPEMTEDLSDLQKLETLTVIEDQRIYIYKLLEKNMQSEYRASYIYLDGSELSIKQIDSLRPMIIEKYKAGIAFSELVAAYNMDGNSNKGDLGWFKQGAMVPEFESAVRDQKVNEIFTVDVPYKNWYYVALKTHENRKKEYWTFVKVRIFD